jgi:hypothetical protein
MNSILQNGKIWEKTRQKLESEKTQVYIQASQFQEMKMVIQW